MRHNFRLLTKADTERVKIDLKEAANIIEDTIKSLGTGDTKNPDKLSLSSPPHLMTYAMLGGSVINQTIGMKNSFKFIVDKDSNETNYYSFLSLFDASGGFPLALIDGGLITAIRTSLVSGLIARECAKENACSALIIGSGTQGKFAVAGLLACHPGIHSIGVFGHYEHSVQQILANARQQFPDKQFSKVTDLKSAVQASDIIFGVAGPLTSAVVKAEWIQPGTLMVLVGYGIGADALHTADRVVATSAGQMQVTGADLVDKNGNLPKIDAELPEILLRKKIGRTHNKEKIFAYNSGLIVTDIALGRVVYEQAIKLNLGTDLNLW